MASASGTASTMPTHCDGMFLALEGKADRTLNDVKACVCGKEECEQLTKQHKAIGDVRGTCFNSPTHDPSCCTEPLTAFQQHQMKKLERFRTHLRLSKNAHDIASVDNRKRSTKGPVATRNADKQTKQTRRCVAHHHFHPTAINHHILFHVSTSCGSSYN